MAAQTIVISQDNIISSKALLTINNPLIFLITVTYTGIPEDTLSVIIYNNNATDEIINLTAVAYSDPAAGTRIYILSSDQILKGLSDKITDSIISNNQIILDTLHDLFKIEVKILNDSSQYITDYITFTALQGAVQFGSSPCKTDIYDNIESTFIAYEGFWGYVYFYNSITTADISLTGIQYEGQRYNKGLLKVKKDTDNVGIETITLYWYQTQSKTMKLDVRKLCTDQILIKYIDRNGMFRFYAFNKFHQQKISTKEIGRTNKLITNILTDQSNTDSLGFNSVKIISLVADDVSDTDLVLLEDLYVSPVIYMYIGSGSDDVQSWLLMKNKSNELITRKRKGSYTQIELQLEYPEQQTIKTI